MDAEQGGKGWRNAPRAADKQAVRMFGCEATPPPARGRRVANFFRRKKICHSEYRGCLNPHFWACYSESMSTSTPPVRPGPYAIVGAAKYKTMKGITYHVLRLGSESHGDGVDPSSSHLNIYEGAQD